MEATRDSRAGIVDVDTTRELRQLGTGMALGRYTLVRRVAAGGMAEVYAARSQGISGFEKKVAIKKILPQFSLNRRFVDMLVDEAKITVSLTHPNIAQIYELGLDGDTYYIVMEYVDGRPLNRLMMKLDLERSETVPVEHAAHIMGEVAKGLHHAHQQKDPRGRPLKIVHRDVSPQNVLLAYSGDVKLIDFGIARAAGRAAQTNAGTIKGKLRYLAPEIAMGEEPDHRADVYCCGIVLFEMLTGEALFAPRTDVEAIELATEARVRSPRLANPKVPGDLEDIVMKALRRDREERYPTAKALHADLRRFLNHHFPAYLGSELGDLMQERFAPEIAEDRRLDALAEQVIERIEAGGDETLGVPDGELAGHIAALEAPAKIATGSGGYRQLVTRTGIEAPPPAEEKDDEEAEFEPTQRAVNPLIEGDAARAEPTVAAPPPSAPEGRRPLDETGEVVHPEAETGEIDSGAATLPRMDAPSPDERLPPDLAEPAARRPSAPPRLRPAVWPFVLAAIGVVALGLWVGMSAGTSGPAPPAPRVEAPLVAPVGEVPPVPATASLTLRVTPEVPFEVLVGDTVAASEVVGVTTLHDLPSTGPVRVEVRALGYQPWSVVETFPAGDAGSRSVTLAPLTGSLRLVGLDGAKLSASVGVVDGDVVRDVPLGAEVELVVSRPKSRTWRETVKVVGVEPITVEVPEARRLAPPAKGTLFVNSRPYSQIYLNGRAKGRTPRTLDLSPGRYTVVLKRPDGTSMSRSVEVRSSQKTDVVVRWP